MGKGIMLIRRFVLKVINFERTILTHHEIIDRTTEQIVLVVTQRIKIVDSSELTAAKFVIYLFTYFVDVHAWTLKKELSLRK